MIVLAIILILLPIFIKNNRVLKPKKKMNSFCFLIPARDESRVIEELIKSIFNQTVYVNPKDIYVIVENENDPTVHINQKYGIKTIIRKNFKIKTKGGALDEALRSINKKYDAYFIMDADNVLDKNFVSEMKKSYMEGYDIAIGYRNAKNGNDSLIAGASVLTFSLLNTVLNKEKQKNNKNVTISGTGFYISRNILNKFEGYPFYSLTEDYELTLYSILNNISVGYNEKAIFYDEQPIIYKNTINQRKRWIKGYFQNRKKYVPLIRKNKDVSVQAKLETIIGAIPYILLVISIIYWLIYFIFNKKYLINIIILLTIYIILMLVTYLILKMDNKLLLSKKMKRELLFFHPFYLLSYIHIALLVLISPNVTWDKVNHTRNVKLKNN